MQSEPTQTSWLRRLIALMLDWAASSAVAAIFLGGVGVMFDPTQSTKFSSLTLLIYFLEKTLGTAFAGGSFGQLAFRLRVVKVTGGLLNIWQAGLRAALVCLVIPPLVFKSDGRGLHDLAVGSTTIELKRG